MKQSLQLRIGQQLAVIQLAFGPDTVFFASHAGFKRAQTTQFTLNPSDGAGESGVSITEYQLNGGGWVTYVAPFTVASEVMAILCLAKDLKDLERRLGDMIVAYRRDKSPIYCRDIKADGAMTVVPSRPSNRPKRKSPLTVCE